MLPGRRKKKEKKKKKNETLKCVVYKAFVFKDVPFITTHSRQFFMAPPNFVIFFFILWERQMLVHKMEKLTLGNTSVALWIFHLM